MVHILLSKYHFSLMEQSIFLEIQKNVSQFKLCSKFAAQIIAITNISIKHFLIYYKLKINYSVQDTCR